MAEALAALGGLPAPALDADEWAAVAPLVRLMAELWTIPVPPAAPDEVFDAAWKDDGGPR
jgi:hypothetical protein